MNFFGKVVYEIKFRTVDLTVGVYAAFNHLCCRNKPYTDDIVIYLENMHLGDLLVICGSISGFLKKFPERGFSVICDAKMAEAAKTTGIFNRVYCADHKKALSRIKAKDFIGVLPWIGGHKPNYIARIITADRKWFGKDEINKYLTDRELARYEKKYTNVVDLRYSTLSTASFSMKVARMLSAVSGTDIKPDVFRFNVTAREPGTYFIVNPGAAHLSKSWPVDRFAAVIQYICHRTDLTPVVVGGQFENRLCLELTEILSRIAPDVQVKNMCCRTDLKQLTELMGSAAFYLGNDTGTTHVAVSCGIPSVSVTSGYFDDSCLPYPAGLDSKTVVIKSGTECPYDGKCFRANRVLSDSCRECVDTHGVFECLHTIDAQTVIEEMEKSGILASYVKSAKA